MKTADEIYQEMCLNYAELTGVTVRDGCDMAVRLYAAAAQIESLYAYNDWVKSQCFPQTATGEHLDLHAEMRGLQRIGAVYSTGYIKFFIRSPAEQEVEVPEGTVCVTAAGVMFTTIESNVITVGETSCECRARAVDNGPEGNVDANTIVYMQQAPIGISSCVNEYAFSGGADSENDDSLRERILATYRSLPNGANAAFYEKLVMGVSGVSAVKVIPKNRGVGTVDIVITGTDGLPDNNLLIRVLRKVEGAREICVDIEVHGPTAVTVNINVSIEVENGYSFDTVSENVRQAISDYFTGELLGCDVLKVKLGNIIYGVEGVRNYTITAPANDVSISDTELPVLGTLTVNALS